MREKIYGGRIETLDITMFDDRFEREKAYIEQQKKRFEFVKSYETYDLYKHKTKDFYECFSRY